MSPGSRSLLSDSNIDLSALKLPHATNAVGRHALEGSPNNPEILGDFVH